MSKVNITVEDRPDGGVRVYSDDLPGLILSGLNRRAVSADIITAIDFLRNYTAEQSDKKCPQPNP